VSSRGELGRNLAVAAIAVAATASLIGVGYALGRRQASRPFAALFAGHETARTLAQLVPPEQRAVVAQAYLDPDAALAHFDEIPWTPRYAAAPFLGFAPAPGGQPGATIDALSMRGAGAPRMPKPAGTLRVFVTGGSVAFGAGAPADDRTIGAFLQTALNETARAGGRRVEVFTLAAPGWTSTHERIAIENRLSELAPDLVISFSGINDLYLGSIGRDPLWSRSFGDQLFWDLLGEAHRVAGEAPPADVAPEGQPPLAPDEVARRVEKNVRLAAQTLEPGGARYLYAFQPNIAYAVKQLTPREMQILSRYRFRDFNRSGHALIDRRLRALVLPGFRYADLADVFATVPAGQEIFLDTGHLGDRGNHIVAERLAAEVAPLLAPSVPAPDATKISPRQPGS
jgi:hypothetical protein